MPIKEITENNPMKIPSTVLTISVILMNTIASIDSHFCPKKSS